MGNIPEVAPYHVIPRDQFLFQPAKRGGIIDVILAMDQKPLGEINVYGCVAKGVGKGIESNVQAFLFGLFHFGQCCVIGGPGASARESL